ncbi:MAG: thioredoxin [Leptospiraceae bacterium]|nr:thioredoxin [Leptospiraceae bacterium]MCP5496060.1 thioredoxin [Leptospiraceae bacterium]
MEKTLPKSFEELIATHEKPILVDFWAEWCGPCRMLSPVIAQLSKEWQDKITVIKINTDEQSNIATKYNITGIPTVILFKDGKETKRISGALPLPRLKAEFESYLS